jgi:hypothetical protein
MARRKSGVLYVIARNEHGRPTLQHKLSPGTSSLLSCSTQDISQWSRAYQAEPIPEVLCRKSKCRE